MVIRALSRLQRGSVSFGGNLGFWAPASVALVQDSPPPGLGQDSKVPLLTIFIYPFGCGGSFLWHSGAKARRAQ